MPLSRLQYLARKFSAADLSVSEWNELQQLINSHDDESLVNELLSTAETFQIQPTVPDPKLTVMAESIVAIDRSARIQETPKIRWLSKAWIRYAAAVIILVAGVAVFNFFRSDKKSVPNTVISSAEENIQPGFSRAVLTLSDGRKVKLDTTGSQFIADGNIAIKNANGQLTYSNTKASVTNTMTTPIGGQYQLTLADGTRVWLNAASSITFPTAFVGKRREVTISGEVYMEVTPDKTRPFVVHSKTDSILVLGTSFNVNAYEDEPASKITLIEGSIRIGTIKLTPGQAYVNGSVTTTDIRQDIAWKNGIFNFHRIPLESALRQLARWYDLTIVFRTKSSMMLGGTMGRDLSLQEVLKIFSEMGVKYKLRGKVLEIQ